MRAVRTRSAAEVFGICALLLASVLWGCGPRGTAALKTAISEAGPTEPGTTVRYVPADRRDTVLGLQDAEHAQWAVRAMASSTLREEVEDGKYDARQAMGRPNVTANGIDGRAWGPLEENSGYEWLQLRYEVPVHATSVRIKEVNVPGSIAMVQLIDDRGVYHLKWKGRSKHSFGMQWMVLDFPPTPYLVNGVKITLDTTRVTNWKLIDAVQLVGTRTMP